jgi:hypothetical protein
MAIAPASSTESLRRGLLGMEFVQRGGTLIRLIALGAIPAILVAAVAVVTSSGSQQAVPTATATRAPGSVLQPQAELTGPEPQRTVEARLAGPAGFMLRATVPSQATAGATNEAQPGTESPSLGVDDGNATRLPLGPRSAVVPPRTGRLRPWARAKRPASRLRYPEPGRSINHIRSWCPNPARLWQWAHHCHSQRVTQVCGPASGRLAARPAEDTASSCMTSGQNHATV